MNSIKIIIAILSFGLFSCQGQETGKVEQLDAKTFSEKITSSNDIQLLDVRTPGEFQDQHIDHATNINWNGANFEKEVAVLDKSKPVYIYCKSGGRSNQAGVSKWMPKSNRRNDLCHIRTLFSFWKNTALCRSYHSGRI